MEAAIKIHCDGRLQLHQTICNGTNKQLQCWRCHACHEDCDKKTMTMTRMPPTTSCSDCTAFTLNSATDFSRASAFGEDRYDDVDEWDKVYDYNGWLWWWQSPCPINLQALLWGLSLQRPLWGSERDVIVAIITNPYPRDYDGHHLHHPLTIIEIIKLINLSALRLSPRRWMLRRFSIVRSLI